MSAIQPGGAGRGDPRPGKRTDQAVDRPAHGGHRGPLTRRCQRGQKLSAGSKTPRLTDRLELEEMRPSAAASNRSAGRRPVKSIRRNRGPELPGRPASPRAMPRRSLPARQLRPGSTPRTPGRIPWLRQSYSSIFQLLPASVMTEDTCSSATICPNLWLLVSTAAGRGPVRGAFEVELRQPLEPGRQVPVPTCRGASSRPEQSTPRTIVASIGTAAASPTPICLNSSIEEGGEIENTATITIAAEVTGPAVRRRPASIASEVLSPWSCASRIRLRMNVVVHRGGRTGTTRGTSAARR